MTSVPLLRMLILCSFFLIGFIVLRQRDVVINTRDDGAGTDGEIEKAIFNADDGNADEVGLNVRGDKPAEWNVDGEKTAAKNGDGEKTAAKNDDDEKTAAKNGDGGKIDDGWKLGSVILLEKYLEKYGDIKHLPGCENSIYFPETDERGKVVVVRTLDKAMVRANVDYDVKQQQGKTVCMTKFEIENFVYALKMEGNEERSSRGFYSNDMFGLPTSRWVGILTVVLFVQCMAMAHYFFNRKCADLDMEDVLIKRSKQSGYYCPDGAEIKLKARQKPGTESESDAEPEPESELTEDDVGRSKNRSVRSYYPAFYQPHVPMKPIVFSIEEDEPDVESESEPEPEPETKPELYTEIHVV